MVDDGPLREEQNRQTSKAWARTHTIGTVEINTESRVEYYATVRLVLRHPEGLTRPTPTTTRYIAVLLATRVTPTTPICIAVV